MNLKKKKKREEETIFDLKEVDFCESEMFGLKKCH